VARANGASLATEGESPPSGGRWPRGAEGETGWATPVSSILSATKNGLAAWLPVLPLILLAGAFLIAPTIGLVINSVHNDEVGWTLQFWRDTLESNGGKQVIRTSIEVGLICASLSLLIGGPLAWLISRMFTARRSVWLALLNVSANFGGIGLAFGYIAALGTYGMVTLFMQDIGIPFDAPQMGTVASLILAYEYTNVPLFVLLTLPAMGILRSEWLEAAEVAHATRTQFWRYIGMPVLTPFLAAGWLLIFTWSIGIYGLAYAMAGTASQTGRLRLITIQIGLHLNTGVGREERSYVLAVVLLLLAMISLLAFRLSMRWALRWFV
jgi:putative spermidine/putrescine transport system permease protein